MPLAACQAPYLIKSAWNQVDLLTSRRSLDVVLDQDSRGYTPLAAGERDKLLLAREAKVFAETALGLKHTRNYETYVALDRPYVSYVVSAAPADRLEHYLWSFPFVGSVPYKGYFNPRDAEAEAAELKTLGYDTSVRGVSAYSTLGWFNDPILSSMLRYSAYDLVNTIVHETTHATLYIRSQADFNERLASFVGMIGADLFFETKEGKDSKNLAAARDEAQDDKLFAGFISKELESLKAWYTAKESQLGSDGFAERKAARLKEISLRFERDVKPRLKNSKTAANLSKELASDKLNNARLLTWKLYVYDMSDFEKLYEKLGRNPRALIEFAKSLEKDPDPEAKLKAAISAP